MWCFNVARSLARSAGLAVTPEPVPQNNEDMFAAGEAYLQRNEPGIRCIIKVHRKIQESHHVKVIYGTRDLRDRIYSMCRFRNLELDERTARAIVANTVDMDRHYDRWSPSSILQVAFEDIERDSLTIIRSIADFIGLPDTSADTIRQIGADLSKDNVRKKITELDSRAADAVGKPSADLPPVVKGGDDNLRNFDLTTGFQTGHVSDYRPGDWQQLWSDEQKRLVDDAIRFVHQSLEENLSGPQGTPPAQ